MAEGDAGIDAGAIITALGLQGGWFAVAVLVAVVLWLLLTGRIVPRSAVDDERADTATWREAAEERARQVSDLQRLVAELTVTGRAGVKAMQAIQELPRMIDGTEATT